MYNKVWRRLVCLLLSVGLMSGSVFGALAAETTDALSREETRDALLHAADDYNPDVTAEDVLQGYPDGTLDEEKGVSRVEALVMLSRAFGGLPAPTGDTARWGVSEFTDVPNWAQEELADVLASGILVGNGEGLLRPHDPITGKELTLLIQRTYALLASNLKDDFYATVNKEWMDSAAIPPGYGVYNTITELAYDTDQLVMEMIQEIAAGEHEDGSPEDLIKTLYNNILDWDARNAAGVQPLKPYLDAIDGAATLDELMEVHNTIIAETTAGTILAFGITQDLADTTQKVLYFGTFVPALPKEYYANEAVVQVMTQYCATMLQLAGADEETALAEAAVFMELEIALANASMSAEDAADINKSYHVYQSEELASLFSTVDLDAVREASGLPARDTCVISDPGLLELTASLLTEDNLEMLKIAARLNLITAFGSTLSREFVDATNAFNEAITGVTAAADETVAASTVQNNLSDYLGPVYVERYFSAEAKAGVEKMTEDILNTFALRIQALDWMGEATKEKAVEKLESITVNVGYPDQWADPYGDVELRSTDEGGSFLENILTMNLAILEDALAAFEEPVDKTAWQMPVYMVNAYYDPTANSINFPAAILQPPFYDEDADYTENLGGIGYVIAHEITHAFDNTGAQFDVEGNMNNWWTEEDYAAFQELCGQVVAFYDGVEVIPGVSCNGALTIGENVADLGALACITQIEGTEEEPDYQTLYRCASRSWRSVGTREIREYYAAVDVHAPDKLRGNRVLQSLDEFYEAFDIGPGDGMYLEPEARVQVW